MDTDTVAPTRCVRCDGFGTVPRRSWRLTFGIEFLRVNERVAFGLSVADLVSLAVIAVGGIMLLAADRTRQTVPSGSQLS